MMVYIGYEVGIAVRQPASRSEWDGCVEVWCPLMEMRWLR